MNTEGDISARKIPKLIKIVLGQGNRRECPGPAPEPVLLALAYHDLRRVVGIVGRRLGNHMRMLGRLAGSARWACSRHRDDDDGRWRWGRWGGTGGALGFYRNTRAGWTGWSGLLFLVVLESLDKARTDGHGHYFVLSMLEGPDQARRNGSRGGLGSRMLERPD